jgi:hypothetical protein
MEVSMTHRMQLSAASLLTIFTGVVSLATPAQGAASTGTDEGCRESVQAYCEYAASFCKSGGATCTYTVSNCQIINIECTPEDEKKRTME